MQLHILTHIVAVCTILTEAEAKSPNKQKEKMSRKSHPASESNSQSITSGRGQKAIPFNREALSNRSIISGQASCQEDD